MSDETPEFGGFGVGSRLAGYRLDEQIGRGGMAVVYRAYDIRLERPVAIKVLSPELARDEAFRQRFIRESRTAAAVDHPNIIPIFEAGEANGVLFIAMRFVHGPNVQELVDTEGPLPPPGPATSSPRSPPAWRRLIRTGWCTGTSSRATCCSTWRAGETTPATRTCPISA